jgi:hypothetical protein
MKRVLSIVTILVLSSCPVFALSLLSPGDFIIAIDADGMISNSWYPGGEAPPNALDSTSTTKYLNSGGANSGFIVTPSAAAQVQSFTITTANDVDGRDPLTWELYGTNAAIGSADNSTGLGESWTLLDSGAAALPTDRYTLGPVVTVNNASAWASYKMLYPTLKGSNLMQVADVAFYQSTDGTGTSVLSVIDPILAIQLGPDSRYPGAEGPANAIDGTLNKYLNFGENNSGFIVTPSVGPSTVESFQITTANDSPERDPRVWFLYGTNDVIASADNSTGTAENWTLIAAGTMALPDARNVVGPAYVVANQLEEYTSYKMQFVTVKDAAMANSMQIAEIQFYGVPEPATLCLLGLGGLSLVLRRRSH